MVLVARARACVCVCVCVCVRVCELSRLRRRFSTRRVLRKSLVCVGRASPLPRLLTSVKQLPIAVHSDELTLISSRLRTQRLATPSGQFGRESACLMVLMAVLPTEEEGGACEAVDVTMDRQRRKVS